MKKKIYIFAYNHFDPIWRYEFEDYYAEVEETIILKTLRIMERYPEFCSKIEQASVVRKFFERNPDKVELLKRKIKEGQLEIVGGTESIGDVNLPSGESIVRNILYGKQWFEDKLGVEVKTASLEDVFGMSIQIPQILVASGYNCLLPGRVGIIKVPPLFYWEGLDGSKIMVIGAHLLGSWNDFEHIPDQIEQEDFADDFLVVGISGEENIPTERLPKSIRRWNEKFSDKEFIFSLPQEVYSIVRASEREGKITLPVLKGEFNPVFTGCYSDKIKIKQRNREVENILGNAEKSRVIAGFYGLPYPDNFVQAYRPVLFNQFHDGICGCNADEVYYSILERYGQSEDIAQPNLDEGLAKIVEQINTVDSPVKNGIPVIVFNFLPWQRKDLCTLKNSRYREKVVVDYKGRLIPSENRSGEISFIAKVPSMGYSTYFLVKGKSETIKEQEIQDKICLENDKYRLHFSKQGLEQITLKNGEWGCLRSIGNRLYVEEDQGHLWLERLTGNKVEVQEEHISSMGTFIGPVRQTMKISGEIPPFSFGEMDLEWMQSLQLTKEEAVKVSWEQEIILYKSLDRIDFLTRVLWNGRNARLRVKFPTTISNSRAQHHVPFAVIERRPYNANILASGDYPIQYFVSLAEEKDKRRVTLVSPGIPGVEVLDGEMRISLLRAPKIYDRSPGGSYIKPGDSARQIGEHSFKYSLVLHSGDGERVFSHRVAEEVNCPLLPIATKIHTGSLSSQMSFLSISSPMIMLSTMKGAETKSKGNFVLRVYEIGGKAVSGKVIFFRKIREVYETDLLERKRKKKLYSENKEFTIQMKPYQIKTIEVVCN